MTPQEQEMIDGLVGRVRSTQMQNMDAAAEQHIQQGLAGVPDALYILVQTVLVQQYGLEQAQAQISALQGQIQALQQQAQHPAEPSPASGGSFLSHLFGGAASTPAQTAPQTNYQQVNYPPGSPQGYPGNVPPPPPYGQPSYPQQGGGTFGSGGGFLHNALQTAAGVAAGEMMFRGMEDLFSGFGGHERGFTGQGAETVGNNYNDDSSVGDRNADTRNENSNFYNPSDDASRQAFNDNSANFGGFNADNSNPDDSSSLGDNSADFGDTGSDDFSSDDTV